MRRSTLFILSLLLWVLLTWPVGPVPGVFRAADLSAGVVVAMLVALVMGERNEAGGINWLEPSRWFWGLVYLLVFVGYVFRANFDVAYRVLHPDMPIRPGIVKVKSSLRTDAARTVLANCITLTPGTLSVDIADDGTFYIHWINVWTREGGVTAWETIGRFEWFIKRVFE
jgi:multicomponent Na+:H+ antiporter subunit E